MTANGRCNHFEAYIRGDDPVGQVYCPNCELLINAGDVFNRWLCEFRRLKIELDKELTR